MKSPLKEDICNCIGHVIKEKEKKGQKPKDAKVFLHDKNGASATNMEEQITFLRQEVSNLLYIRGVSKSKRTWHGE